MQKSGQNYIPPQFRNVRVAGQVPSREALEALRLAQTPPKKVTVARIMSHSDPVFRVEGIVKGLGMDPALESSWKQFLDSQLNGNTNELVMRKSIYERMVFERMDPEMRKAIFQRSMVYRKESLRKSLVHIVNDADILEKAGARGGEYHRRVPKAGGKGYRYIYEESKYNSMKDAHLSGKDARKARINKAVSSMVETSEKGCGIAEMKGLAKKFGPADVASSLRDHCGTDGGMEYKSGKFSMKKPKDKEPLKKSLSPDFLFVLGRTI